MKSVRVVLSPEAENVYNRLCRTAPTSKTERMLLRACTEKIELIKTDCQYGDPIRKSLIPEEYKRKYNITNLFRVELSGFWRLLYTLTNQGSENEIVCFILDILDHPAYDKKFGYRGR